MLGQAFANSTNYPDYNPQWIGWETWHIGAQYFMALCPTDHSMNCSNSWIAKAPTGELMAVGPLEIIETTIRLVQKKQKRTLEVKLRIGVLGQPHRAPTVFADRSFMGLVSSTQSWEELDYENVYVGSCLENYIMMMAQDNYSPTWKIWMELWSPGRLISWEEWFVSPKDDCDWQPKSTLSSNHTLTKQ